MEDYESGELKVCSPLQQLSHGDKSKISYRANSSSDPTVSGSQATTKSFMRTDDLMPSFLPCVSDPISVYGLLPGAEDLCFCFSTFQVRLASHP